MQVHLLQPDEIPWGELDSFTDRNIFQTKPWLEFLCATQGGTPAVAELRDGARLVGYFTGVMVRRFGLRMLGSPMPGWMTPYMGFNLLPDVPRWLALEAVREFAFRQLGCVHVEVTDRHVSEEDGCRAGFLTYLQPTYLTDLTQSEEALLKNIRKGTRWSIRKAEKLGLTIEPSADPEFVEEYYDQVKDVFAKQNLVPTYPVERVRRLIQHLLPTGNLVLLRVREPEGRCVATGIFEGWGETAYPFGSGSYRRDQHLCPNQALLWYALRYWKARGAKVFDWVGRGEYKEAYGVSRSVNVWCRASRFAVLETLRKVARAAYRLRQLAAGRLHSSVITKGNFKDNDGAYGE